LISLARWKYLALGILLLTVLSPIVATMASGNPVNQGSFNVSNDPQASSDGHVAVSGNHVYVVWASNDSSSSEILFKASPDNGVTWNPTMNLSADSGKSLTPRVKAVGSQVLVFWTDNSPGKNEVYFRTSHDYGQTWAHSTDLSNTSSPSSHFRILVTGSHVYAAWVEKQSHNNQVVFTSSDDSGQTWTQMAVLSTNVNNSENIRLGAFSSDIFVMWNGNSTGHFQVFLRSSSDWGETWNHPENVSNDAGNATIPDFRVQAVGSSVYLYAVWQDDTPGINVIMFSASLNLGATWASPKQLSSSLGSSLNPSIDALPVASKPNVAISWAFKPGGGTYALFSMSSNAGATFSQPVSLGSSLVASGGVRMLVQSHGILLAWIDSASGNNNPYLRVSQNFGITFGSTINLSGDSGTSSQVSLSDNYLGSGSVYVVWTDSSTGNGDIYIQRLASSDDSMNASQLPVPIQGEG
jgi:uncharacterized protein (DUF736 family)